MSWLLVTFKLRDYQIELVEGVQESMLNGNKKILVQSAAGSGKSITMAEIAKRATDKGNRVMFVVHRRELVAQIKNTFRLNGVNQNLCYIGMVQTVTRRLDKFEHEPQIILVDEAHHSLAKTYLRIFGYFSNAYTIGFTATPVLLSGRGLGNYYEDLIIGKSVQWLIDNKRLAPFDYYSKNMLDEGKLKNTRGDFSHKSIDEASKGIIYGDVIEHYRELANNTKTIVYTHSVQASKNIAEAFRNAGYKSQSVDGTTPKEIRNKAMEDFRSGEVTILVNAELYGEGVDVPDCETVILLRPTASLTLYIQQSMRSMRYQPNKKATIIDHVANYTRHGIPTTEHEWTLEDRTSKGSGNQTANTIPLKECTNCFGVVESKETICPLCGHEFEVEINELETVDTKLEKIDELSFKTDYEKIKWASKKVSDLETIEDYVKYAEAKGYKKSWIKFQHPELKAMSWPQFYQTINLKGAKINV